MGCAVNQVLWSSLDINIKLKFCDWRNKGHWYLLEQSRELEEVCVGRDIRDIIRLENEKKKTKTEAQILDDFWKSFRY